MYNKGKLIPQKTNMLKKTISFLMPYKGLFIIALICMGIYGATEGAIPFILKHILDGVFADRNKTLLWILPLLLIGFAIFRAIFDFGQQFLTAKIGHHLTKDIRAKLARKILSLPPLYFVFHPAGNILSTLTSDVLLVRSMLTEAAAAILRDTIRIIALLSAAIYLDWKLAAIAFLLFPAGIYPMYRFSKWIRNLTRKAQDGIGYLTSYFIEMIQGNKVIKIFNREESEFKRFNQANLKLTSTYIKSEFYRALTNPVNEVLASIAISGVLLYGGFAVINGTKTQGDFISFLIAVFMLYDPFKKLSKVNNTVQQGLAGASRVFSILDTEEEDTSGIDFTPSNYTIEFINVNFTYPNSTETILKDINLKVQEGQKVAIVGFSGAGKTTLINLIPRFFTPTKGLITIGGIDINTVKLHQLRETIAYVDQHTVLFNDTIYNNIAYGKKNASKEEVLQAAKAAFAFDFISKLENGFDTQIGEGGYSLSGGERQRIAIARAILKNAPILLLDEATATLDSKAEKKVQAALDVLSSNRTSIIIAHRLSTIISADLIVVMKKGEIVEKGSHAELLKKEGEYYKLYNMQYTHLEKANDIPKNIATNI